MGIDPVERFLATLRDGVPNAISVFTTGNCFKLYLILRTVFPDAQPFYSQIRGHVYVKIKDKFYDIEGRHHFVGRGKWGIGKLIYLPDEPGIFIKAFRWKYDGSESSDSA